MLATQASVGTISKWAVFFTLLKWQKIYPLFCSNLLKKLGK